MTITQPRAQWNLTQRPMTAQPAVAEVGVDDDGDAPVLSARGKA